MTNYQTLLTDVTDKVATIWLNRPEHRNSFSPDMTRELYEAFGRFEADDGVRAIVVTGSGKYFSAGADLGRRGGSTFSRPAGSDTGAADSPGADSTAQQQRAERAEPMRMRTPIIAAMNGSAVGMGITLPVSWDLRFAAADAKYGFVFTRRGLIPEQNSLWLLPRLVGLSVALELLLTGRLFSGAEAKELGIATRAVPADDVLPTALTIAHEIATQAAPSAVALTKRLAYEMLAETDREAAFHREWELFRWMGRQPDSAEGVASFVEKRSPEFTSGKAIDVPATGALWAALDG